MMSEFLVFDSLFWIGNALFPPYELKANLSVGDTKLQVSIEEVGYLIEDVN